MAAAKKVKDGTVFCTYQGIPCLYGEYTNPQGIASGSGYVVMTQENFGKLVIDASDAWSPLVASEPGTSDRNPTGGGQIPGLGAGIKIRGDLVFTRAGGGTKALTGIYVADDGVTDERRSAERKKDRGLVRVPLRDVRWLWSRGDFFGRYNWPSRATQLESTTTGERLPALESDSTTKDGGAYTLVDMIRICLRRLPGGLTLAGPAAEIAEAAKIIPIKIDYRGDGAAEVLGRLISLYNFRFVIDLESNQAQIWRFNEGRTEASEDGGVLTALSFQTLASRVSVDPKSVLRRMRSKQYFYRPRAVRVVGRPVIREVRIEGLELVGELPDGSIAPLDECLATISLPASIPPGETGTGTGTGGSGPSSDTSVLDPSHAGHVVLGPGAHPGGTGRAPIGSQAPAAGSTATPTGAAPAPTPTPPPAPTGNGPRAMTRLDAASWVLLHPDQQVSWRNYSLTQDQVAALRRWAFKWFRIPERLSPAFAPILPQRAQALVNGQRRKPAVFADLFDEVPFGRWGAVHEAALADLAERAARIEEGRPSLKDQIAAVDEALDPGKFALFGSGEVVTSETRKRIAKEVIEKMNADADLARAAIRVESREIAESEANEIRFWNHYHVKVNPAVYEVDPAGIVRFQRIIGAVQLAQGRAEGNPALTSGGGPVGSGAGVPVYVSEGATLKLNPTVAIILAYTSNPRARALGLSFGSPYVKDPSGDKSADYVDQYSFLGTLSGDKAGGVQHLNPGGVEPKDAHLLFPRVVRHELKCFEDVNGVTNRAELDAVAKDIVKRELEGLDRTTGESGEAANFYKIQPTGAVTSVTWAAQRTSKGPVARTRWEAGVKPDAPRPGGGWTTERTGGDPGGPTAPDEGGPR